MQDNRSSLTKLIERMDPSGVSIWRNVSENWVHMKRLDKIINIVEQRNDVPGWGLVVPIEYSGTELPEIQELGQSVTQFRQILARNISDDDIRKLKKLAFGDIEKFIVAFSMDPNILFSWLRSTPEGREALVEVSKSPDVRTEIEKRKSYEEIGKRLTEKMRSQDQENVNAKRRSGHE